MNKLILKAAIALLALVLVLPGSIRAQEKKVHIKKVKEENGEKVVIDTVFTIKEGENPDDIIKEFTWVSDGDSLKTFTFDVDIDSDNDGEHNVIIMKKGGDGDWTTHKEFEHKIKVVKDGDHENVFVFSDGDIDKDAMKELHIEMLKAGEDVEKMKIELENEMIIITDELKDIKKLRELEELKVIAEIEDLHEIEKIKNIEVFMPDMHHGDYSYWVHDGHHGNKVSEKEIREAGIKVKADRLDLESFNINIDNGVVDIEFSIAGEASPKVLVYNFYGDKIISGKPEMMNGKYVMKIDLSGKQHGTYYLQIESKNSSTIEKLKL